MIIVYLIIHKKVTKSHRKGNAPYYILLFVDYYVELQKLLSYNLPPKDSAWCLDSYARLVARTATYIRFMIMNLILVGIWLFTKQYCMMFKLKATIRITIARNVNRCFNQQCWHLSIRSHVFEQDFYFIMALDTFLNLHRCSIIWLRGLIYISSKTLFVVVKMIFKIYLKWASP